VYVGSRYVPDAANPGLHGGHRRRIAVDMRLDRDALRGGLVNDRAHLLLGEVLHARILRDAGPRRRRQDLDPVDAVREVHLHCAPHLLDRVESGHQVRILRVGEKCLFLQPRPNLVTGRHDVRSDDGAALHQLLKPNIRIARNEQAGGAHGRHARFERAAERGEVVCVRVRVDQAGQHVHALQVEHADARGHRSDADRRNATFAQHDRGVRGHAAVADVDDVCMNKRGRLVRLRRRRLRHDRHRTAQYGSEHGKSTHGPPF
jgi:hypothetical protein